MYPDGKRQFSWSKGLLLPSLDVCTRATSALLEAMRDVVEGGQAAPALVIVSVTGVGNSARHLPWMYKVSHDPLPGSSLIYHLSPHLSTSLFPRLPWNKVHSLEAPNR